MPEKGWDRLFHTAFRQSRNAMFLVDQDRRFVDVNGAFLALLGRKRSALVGRTVGTIVDGGPVLTPEQWAADLASKRFEGEIGFVCGDGRVVAHHWGAVVEVVTGRRLVLAVALRTSRWGNRLRDSPSPVLDREPEVLSDRELQVVHLVALGRTGPEIADELGIAHNTVRTHVRNAMAKLGARSRAHLVAKALGEAHALEPPR
jgi:PAS domain S-box-containing protein